MENILENILTAREKCLENGKTFNEIHIEILLAIELALELSAMGKDEINIKFAVEVIKSVMSGESLIYGAKIKPVYPEIIKLDNKLK